MLVIRAEQLHALNAARRAQFRRGVLARARAEMPALAAVPEETLAACIAAAIEAAGRHDIFGDAAVARFALISAALAFSPPDPETARAAAEALDDDALSTLERLERAETLVRPAMR